MKTNAFACIRHKRRFVFLCRYGLLPALWKDVTIQTYKQCVYIVIECIFNSAPPTNTPKLMLCKHTVLKYIAIIVIMLMMLSDNNEHLRAVMRQRVANLSVLCILKHYTPIESDCKSRIGSENSIDIYILVMRSFKSAFEKCQKVRRNFLFLDAKNSFYEAFSV